MKFTILREALLKPLNLVAGVVERRQTLPILANVQLVLEDQELSLTGTDLEVELIGRMQLASPAQSGGEITVPARKLTDICKSLPEGSELDISLDDEQQRLTMRCGRSRFTLSTLPASDFPSVEQSTETRVFEVGQADLKALIEHTAFAMAQQDVRYYLNGMLWELDPAHLRLVATDGHRLAMATLETAIDIPEPVQVIVPRKGVIELGRLLQEGDDRVQVMVSSNHIRVVTGDFTFTSKLIDGKFPDYEKVLPRRSTKTVIGARNELRQAFSRAAILSNEKYRGIRLQLSTGNLQIFANNPEQEEAEEAVPVEYEGENLEIGFNVSYLLDVLTVLKGEQVRFSLADPNSSALLEEENDGNATKAVYVVMPMRL